MDIFGLDSTSNEPINGPITPIESIDYEDEETLLNWAKDLFSALHDAAIARRAMYRANICRYKGFYSKYEPVIDSKNNPGLLAALGTKSKWPKIITNHTRNLVDQKVAKLMKVQPISEILPNNIGQYEDKISSLNAKKIVDTVKYRHNERALMTRLARRSVLFGEAYLKVCWDPEMGEFDPSVRGAVKKVNSDRMFLKDTKYGVTVTNQKGDPTYVEMLPRIGDVGLKLLHPECVYLIPGPSDELCDSPGVCIVEFVHVFRLRAQYPDLEHEILPTKDLELFNLDTLEEDPLENHVAVFHWYFKTSPWLPFGMYFCNTPDTILKPPTHNPMPYSPALGQTETGNLPIVRLTDVEIDGYLYGWSSMNDIAQLQVLYDKLTTWMAKNIFYYCTPKWMLPRGSASYEQLASGMPFVQFNGPTPPTLATYTAISQEQFALQDLIKGNMGQLSGIYQHSLGEAPTGTRSASQLMIYDEQEEEARDTFRHKLEQCAVSVDAKILSLCSAFYEPGDERLIQIVGDNQDWIVEPFQPEDLKKDYVIRIKPGGMLPENKYARIRTLIELRTAAPNEFTEKQLLEAIQFGQHEKLLDYAQVAVMAAEAENELLLQGKEVLPPEPFEDLLTHWKIHAKALQNFRFKKLPKKIQVATKEHVGATEMLMMVHANDNPMFKEFLLSGLPLFPLVYVMPETPLGMPGMAATGGMPAPAEPQANGAASTNGGPPTMGLGGEPRDPSQRQPVPA